MSLPPGFLDELRARVSISSVVGRKVTWDMRKSNMAKGDMWAPCPFHQEKNASFHVDDKKGFYYCFGCQAKGDVLTFLREADNMSFMEAVEVLARDAGMPMPARDPQAQQKSDRRSQLVAVMEQAARFYRMQLNSAAAADARAYLTRRGLKPDALERHGIGFAADTRQGLWAHLTGAGVAADLIVDAGLAIRPDDGGQPYDRFRGRIMFPIRDGRDRCIAFGGRAMSENARAKYLNSPETELFDKGRTLYNIGPARSACGKGTPLIVAEGYMDVIALVEGGFAAAVAPLGTAITEDQLRLIWRLAPEPVIALDGDSAGLRAGQRLMDLALPLIEAGQSMRFCLLPEKQDPDDVLRAGGPPAMQKLIDGAVPVVTLLWQRETEGQNFDSPERRAALDLRLRQSLSLIRDPSLRGHYADELRRLRQELFAPAPRAGRTFTPRRGGANAPWADRRTSVALPPLASTRSTLLGGGQATPVEDQLREAIILAILITHPGLIATFEADLDRAELSDPDHHALRLCLLRQAADPAAAVASLRDDHADALDRLMAQNHVRIAPPVHNRHDTDLARRCLAEEFAKLKARRGAARELRDAMEDLDHLADEGVTWRLSQAAAARHAAERSKLEDSADLGENRQELSKLLQNLIDDEIWVKKKH
ncbi:DNA primase [Roseicitreum antarcticum]|nr:DNA primase [Roseicitreum antarcticum]